MIGIRKYDGTGGEALAQEIAACLSAGQRTNCYFPPEEWVPLAAQGRVSRMDFAGGRYLLIEKGRQADLLYFLEEGASPVPPPEMGRPVVLEQVGSEKAGVSPSAEEWEAAGFRRYLQRKRLFLAAKNVEPEGREACFCGEAEQAEVQGLLERSFEPYTSALPDSGALAVDLREGRVLAARENGGLLGFLRFGREKRVSVLRQVAVQPAARGRGIAARLVRDWLALERGEVLKFQLWVREDNPPALALYRRLGFRPDGRIAPVMIKGLGGYAP